MAKVFLTGATGYVGGQILHDLARSGSRFSVTALVRDELKAKTVAEKFPSVKIVQGSLDDTKLVEQEASASDIVLNFASNKHTASLEAMERGLSSRNASNPAYLLQVSGASLLAVEELSSSTWIPGSPSARVFDDLSGVEEIRGLIRAYPARAVDNLILDIAERSKGIKTALILPPTIYGQGQGPVHTTSIQIPTLAQAALNRGHGVVVGKGENTWGQVHVRDLGSLILALATEAAQKSSNDKLWSDQGIYLTAVSEMTFRQVSEKIVAAAVGQKLLKPGVTIQSLSPGPEADSVLPAASVLYGTNARGRGLRAAELLGWQPTSSGADEAISEAVSAAAAVV